MWHRISLLANNPSPISLRRCPLFLYRRSHPPSHFSLPARSHPVSIATTFSSHSPSSNMAQRRSGLSATVASLSPARTRRPSHAHRHHICRDIGALGRAPPCAGRIRARRGLRVANEPALPPSSRQQSPGLSVSCHWPNLTASRMWPAIPHSPQPLCQLSPRPSAGESKLAANHKNAFRVALLTTTTNDIVADAAHHAICLLADDSSALPLPRSTLRCHLKAHAKSLCLHPGTFIERRHSAALPRLTRHSLALVPQAFDSTPAATCCLSCGRGREGPGEKASREEKARTP